MKSIRHILLISQALLVICMTGCGGGSSGNMPDAGSPATQTTASTSALTLVAPPTPDDNNNVVPVSVDGAGRGIYNRAYITLTICPPGTTGSSAACVKLNHVVVDTGSAGLVLNVPPEALLTDVRDSSSGAEMGGCSGYGSGDVWGALQTADVYIGGQVARNMTLNNANPDVVKNLQASLPAACARGIGLLAGEDGIIGMSSSLSDPVEAYLCSGGQCVDTNTQSRLANLISQLAVNSNGMILSLPALQNGVSYRPISGTLTLGIGTANNNAMIAGIHIYENGLISNSFIVSSNTGIGNPTILEGPAVLDSGQQQISFPGLTQFPGSQPVATCTNGQYCPEQALMFYFGLPGIPYPTPPCNGALICETSPQASLIPFVLLSPNDLKPNVYAANVGGPATGPVAGALWLGLPFYFGRTVYQALSGAQTPYGAGPFVAF